MTQLLHGSIRALSDKRVQQRVFPRRDLRLLTATMPIGHDVAALAMPSQNTRDSRLPYFESRCEHGVAACTLRVSLHDTPPEIRRDRLRHAQYRS